MDDFNNIKGIIATKAGFQEGCLKYAEEHGISLMEIREPLGEENIIGEMISDIAIACQRMMFLVDEDWENAHGFDCEAYRNQILKFQMYDGPSSFDDFRIHDIDKRLISIATTDDIIYKDDGSRITTIEKLRSQVPDAYEEENDREFCFDNAYINSKYWGKVKILKVVFLHANGHNCKTFKLDATGFLKAIGKDVLSGESKLL